MGIDNPAVNVNDGQLNQIKKSAIDFINSLFEETITIFNTGIQYIFYYLKYIKNIINRIIQIIVYDRKLY